MYYNLNCVKGEYRYRGKDMIYKFINLDDDLKKIKTVIITWFSYSSLNFSKLLILFGQCNDRNRHKYGISSQKLIRKNCNLC